ncbi:MAG: ATP-binding cassette domain-containing protein [Bdellovibrionales bacterium]|nr:ATP-binding cassette domain-containing protein [Bdellovibrionales bacterium]
MGATNDPDLYSKIFQKVSRFFDVGRAELRIIIIYSVVVGFLSLSIPIAVQNLVNSVAFGSILLPIFTLSFMVFVGLGFSAVLKLAQRHVVEWLTLKVFYRTTKQLGEHIPNMREEALDSAYDQTYFSRYLELFSVQKNLSSLIIDVLDFILIVGSGMLIVALYHPAFLLFDFLLIGSLYFVIRVVGRDGLLTKLEESEKKYEIATWIMGLSRPAVALRGSHGAELAALRTEALSQQFIDARGKHFGVLIRQHGGFLIISILASTILLGVGGVLVFKTQLSLGQLVAAEIILAGVLASIANLEKILDRFYSILSSLSKLESLFAIPKESSADKRHPLPSILGKFELSELNYQYHSGPILWSSLTLKIEPGTTVAIIGTSGAGKSTLLEIIYGLRTPSSGVIRADDFDYKDLNIKELRDRIGYAGEFQALPESLRDNILLGKSIEFGRVVEMARDLSIEDAIESLPEGFNTSLESQTLPFSVGQLSRLSLLRALIHEPDVLLVDEVLDELDSKNRKHVLERIFIEMKGKTVFIATHDHEVAKQCDMILELPAGTITRRKS